MRKACFLVYQVRNKFSVVPIEKIHEFDRRDSEVENGSLLFRVYLQLV